MFTSSTWDLATDKLPEATQSRYYSIFVKVNRIVCSMPARQCLGSGPIKMFKCSLKQLTLLVIFLSQLLGDPVGVIWSCHLFRVLVFFLHSQGAGYRDRCFLPPSRRRVSSRIRNHKGAGFFWRDMLMRLRLIHCNSLTLRDWSLNVECTTHGFKHFPLTFF